jgi:hypothetical protein
VSIILASKDKSISAKSRCAAASDMVFFGSALTKLIFLPEWHWHTHLPIIISFKLFYPFSGNSNFVSIS